MQVPLFGFLALCKQHRSQTKVWVTTKESAGAKSFTYKLIPDSRKDKGGCLFFLLMGGLPFICLYTAVIYCPMSDIVAVTSMVPILTYIISSIVLKHRLTWLRVSTITTT